MVGANCINRNLYRPSNRHPCIGIDNILAITIAALIDSLLPMKLHFLTGCLCAGVVSIAIVGCGGDSDKTTSSTKSTETAMPGSIIGKWTGELQSVPASDDSGPTTVVTADIKGIEAGNDASTVEYTGIDCSGTWTAVGVSDGGTTYTYRETITKGESKSCASNGKVTLERGERDQLKYSFSGGGFKATSTLTRTD